MHYLADLWGYWNTNPRYVMSVAVAVGILAVATVVAGFFIIGSPTQARLNKLDAQKVSDLQNIQMEVQVYRKEKGILPAQLSDLADPLSYFTVPIDNQWGTSYKYAVLSNHSFELCATFNAVTPVNHSAYSQPIAPEVDDGDYWIHGIGYTCFVRTIDPQKYPVTPGAASTTPAKAVAQ